MLVNISQIFKSLIDNVPETDPRLPVLKSAMDHLDENCLYNFAAANLKLNHALNYAVHWLEYSAKWRKY
jgi:hypothetical protein